MVSANLSRRDFLKLVALSCAVIQSNLKSPSFKTRTTDGEKKPNILILLFDTFSARHMSLYGYSRQTTPNLARFAERATVYHHHYAGGNFTLPGTASLLTGTYPWSHRGLHYFGTVLESFVDKNIFRALAEDYFISAYTHNAFVMGLFDQFNQALDQITLPKDLALMSEPLTDRLFPEDFAISFWGERVVRGSGNPLPGSLFLSFLEQDFQSLTPESLKQRFSRLFPRGLPYNSSGLFFLLEEAIDWIKSEVAQVPEPFLGYYHLFPPHEPYRPRNEFVNIFKDGWKPKPKPSRVFSQNRSESALNQQRRYYDEYIAYVDAEFGRLYDSLKQSGLLDRTVFIVTSDHGQLFERGIHGHVTSTLYDPLIHIPLIISMPGQESREDVFQRTSCIDLLPTLLQLAGKPIPDWCEGKVLPLTAETKLEAERNIFAVEAKKNPKATPLNIGTVALLKDQFKLIHYFGYDEDKDNYELYDLKNDPDEYENIYTPESSLARDLKHEISTALEDANRRALEG